MAMDKLSLKNRILNELSARGFGVSTTDPNGNNWLDKFAEAIASAIIDEIQQNARAVGTDSNGDSHNLNIV
ncbi:MAG: hypothetical protein DSY42_09370 [Aquifex sp.]|nr:MAG: hypothetical protein DSY42_09370 [Aquifex sp.]